MADRVSAEHKKHRPPKRRPGAENSGPRGWIAGGEGKAEFFRFRRPAVNLTAPRSPAGPRLSRQGPPPVALAAAELAADRVGAHVDASAAGASLGTLATAQVVGAVPAGISRPDDHTFLQATQVVLHAADRRPVGTRVVSGTGRRDERLGRQRGLGDAEQHRSAIAGACPGASVSFVPRRMRAGPSARRAGSRHRPAPTTSTLRSIWRMITSMCLSLIFTPCRR